jgi:hypothetical protein
VVFGRRSPDWSAFPKHPHRPTFLRWECWRNIEHGPKRRLSEVPPAAIDNCSRHRCLVRCLLVRQSVLCPAGCRCRHLIKTLSSCLPAEAATHRHHDEDNTFSKRPANHHQNADAEQSSVNNI